MKIIGDGRIIFEIEKQSLAQEEDQASAERLEGLNHELAELKEKRNALHLQWKNEKGRLRSCVV